MEMLQIFIGLTGITAIGYFFCKSVLSKTILAYLIDLMIFGVIYNCGAEVAAFLFVLVSLFTTTMIFALSSKVINMSHTITYRVTSVRQTLSVFLILTLEVGLITLLISSNGDYTRFGNFSPLHFSGSVNGEHQLFTYTLLVISSALVVFSGTELLRLWRKEC